MSDKPSRSRRSPQESKRLSYERDRVNVYGENDKASRKAIPAFKARSNRTMRRKSNALMPHVGEHDPAGEAALADVTFEGLYPSKRKEPDVALGAVLDARPLKRTSGVDRVPTRGRRESMRAAIENDGRRENMRRHEPAREIGKA